MAKKAVLIFDMPEACWNCPCEYDGMVCTADRNNVRSFPEGFDTTEGKPDWCPLIGISKADITRVELYLDRIKNEKENRL